MNGIRDAAQRSSVIVPFVAVEGSRLGELAAKFDIVMGFTPAEGATTGRPALVAAGAVVNGATFQPGAASGSWVTLFGNNLASNSRTWAAADIVNAKLPESLDGVSVRINNKAAAVQYISPKQINVLAPADGTNGTVQVIVSNANGISDPVNVDLRTLLPGFFNFAQEYVAAVRADGAFLGPAGLIDGLSTVPARPGDAVMLFGTGFGPTNPEAPAGQTFQGAAPLANPVTIRIDTAVANVAFAGLSSAGLYQFNLTVPDLPDGDHAVTAEVGGVRTAKIARLRIQR